MDLIGHDTNFAVTNSVYEANFYDKRFVPSLVQREMVAGGLLGRKSGRGFYAYPAGAPGAARGPCTRPRPQRRARSPCTAAARSPTALEQARRTCARAAGLGPARAAYSAWTGLAIDGARLGAHRRPHRRRRGGAQRLRRDRRGRVRPPAVLPAAPGTALAYAVAPRASTAWRTQAAGLAGRRSASHRCPWPTRPGLVVARTGGHARSTRPRTPCCRACVAEAPTRR
jgi:3-hydroxybutyryl-CoA dehydrogenase